MSSPLELQASWEVTFPKAPTFSLFLLNAELAQDQEAHDMLSLQFKGALERFEENIVAKGDPVQFTWSYLGEKSSFIGFVHTIEKDTAPNNVFTKITCINNSAILKATSKKVYKDLSPDQIVMNIASDNGLTASVSPYPVNIPSLPQSGQSTFQLLRYLAKKTGFALRAENMSIMFKSKDQLLSEKIGSTPQFVHFNAAPKGTISNQTLLQFTALDSGSSPEVDQGDIGTVLYGLNGTALEFGEGYQVTDGELQEDTTNPDASWNNDFGVDGTKAVPQGSAPDPTPAASFNIQSYGAKTSSSNCISNIRAAFEAARTYSNAHGGARVEVYIPKGKWKIKTGAGAELKVFSNLTIRADKDAIIENSGKSYMLMTDNTHYSMTGYNGPTGVIVNGGVWDANLKAKGITFVHSSNITIKNLTIKDHAGDGHGTEINSSSNVLIENCSYLGVRNAGGGKAPRDWDEAIQIDFAWTGAAANTGNDGTPCQNVTIRNCTFGPSGSSGSAPWPRAIGGHQAKDSANRHNNISILNNTIKDCNSTLGGAIRFYNMRNVLIQGNKISKCYRAINGYINTETWGGTSYSSLVLDNIQILDNIIDNCGSWKTHANDSTAQPAIDLRRGSGSGSFSGVTITGNKITNHHGDYGISVKNSSSVTISQNTVPNRHCVGTKSNMIYTTSGTPTSNYPDNS